MEIIATQSFMKSAKPLAKRYKSFNKDYKDFIDDLEKNPYQGTDLGNGLRKIRMAITSKGKGKSGGCRIITFDAIERNGNLYLMYVYDKSDFDNVINSVMIELVKELDI